ncbi:hypothetical protein ACH5RR_029307 [Cinchona calisaya]|uniref:RNase H type-1 domain-containing protein n=1 Tax=Cinchona calisaya TaxID=153742 RepID=A0ABD2YTI6_9GENT
MEPSLKESTRILLAWSMHFLHELRKAIASLSRGVNQSTEPGSSWQLPIQGYVKINVDCAIFVNDTCSGLAVIIRDDKCSLIAALTKRIPGVVAPEIAEAYAAKAATSLATQMGLQQVAF